MIDRRFQFLQAGSLDGDAGDERLVALGQPAVGQQSGRPVDRQRLNPVHRAVPGQVNGRPEGRLTMAGGLGRVMAIGKCRARHG
ncbi:MAG TPA: hypothetical protein PLH39_11265 [Promineifilum sp.]|nr:hypothetical protein [Promineifilum sp.]